MRPTKHKSLRKKNKVKFVFQCFTCMGNKNFIFYLALYWFKHGFVMVIYSEIWTYHHQISTIIHCCFFSLLYFGLVEKNHCCWLFVFNFIVYIVFRIDVKADIWASKWNMSYILFLHFEVLKRYHCIILNRKKQVFFFFFGVLLPSVDASAVI